jgi:hypothetical protein
MDASGTLSIYIDEVNMHHKIKLSDDMRFDSIMFFEEELILVAHFKLLNDKNQAQKVDTFRAITKFEQLKQLPEDEIMIFRIFDKIKVKVDTTTEFPLDLKCTLVIGQEEMDEYIKL